MFDRPYAIAATSFRRSTGALLIALIVSACGRVEHTVNEIALGISSDDPEDIAPVYVESEEYGFELTALLADLYLPWSIEFISGVELLVTEKNGDIVRFDTRTGNRDELSGVPDTRIWGQGGLMDVVLHPGYAENQLIYLSLAAPVESDNVVTRVVRARLERNRLVDQEIVFSADPPLTAGQHFGSALVFDDAGYLYVTSGERGTRLDVQDLDNHLGKVIRLTDSGDVPRDNPFVDVPGALPEIYTLGHRNPQSILIEPESREVWAIEHGPRGGDEVNRLVSGGNYGWPTVGYGREYDADELVGEVTTRSGIEDPVYYFDPSVATAGATFYQGDEFPEWQGDLLIAGLGSNLLVRLVVEGGEVVHREDIPMPDRVRDVEVGPDGLIYLLMDGGILYSMKRTIN